MHKKAAMLPERGAFMHPVIHIFGLELPAYGIMMGAGLLLAFALFFVTRKKYSLSVSDMSSGVLYAVVGGFIGAKLLYIIVEWDSVFGSGSTFFSVLSTGFVFYGGLIGGALMVMVYAKKTGQSIYRFADTMLPCFALAHALGRVGCYLAGCCYGCETESALGVVFPPGGIAPSGIRLLPTQLFEAAFLTVLAFVLLIMLKKQKIMGFVTGAYFTAYPVWRFIIEFFRTDRRGNVGALSTSQFISIFIFAAGVLILVNRFKNKKEKAL